MHTHTHANTFMSMSLCTDVLCGLNDCLPVEEYVCRSMSACAHTHTHTHTSTSQKMECVLYSHTHTQTHLYTHAQVKLMVWGMCTCTAHTHTGEPHNGSYTCTNRRKAHRLRDLHLHTNRQDPNPAHRHSQREWTSSSSCKDHQAVGQATNLKIDTDSHWSKDWNGW